MGKKTVEKARLEEVRTASLQSTEGLLGALTWWSVNDLLIAREDLKAKCTEVGLDADKFLIDSRPRSAFRRALEEAEAENLIRKILDDPEKIVFGVILETADKEKLDLTYNTENVVIFHKADQTLEFKLTQDKAKDIQKRFNKYLESFTSHEVRSMVHSHIRRIGAFPVRDKGGVYFVPVAQVAELDKVSKLINAMSGSYIYVMGIRNEEKEKEGMRRSWRNALDQEIKSVKAEIASTVDKDNKVRVTTLGKRTAMINDLKAQIEVYGKLFGMPEGDEALKDLEELTKTLEKTGQSRFGENQGQRKVKISKKEKKAEEGEKPAEVEVTVEPKAPKKAKASKKAEAVVAEVPADINAALAAKAKEPEVTVKEEEKIEVN